LISKPLAATIATSTLRERKLADEPSDSSSSAMKHQQMVNNRTWDKAHAVNSGQ
jgi:hypothetical protein